MLPSADSVRVLAPLLLLARCAERLLRHVQPYACRLQSLHPTSELQYRTDSAMLRHHRFHAAVHLMSFSCELGLLVVTLLHLNVQRTNDALPFDGYQYLFILLSFLCTLAACVSNIVGAKTMLREVRQAMSSVAAMAVTLRSGKLMVNSVRSLAPVPTTSACPSTITYLDSWRVRCYERLACGHCCDRQSQAYFAELSRV